MVRSRPHTHALADAGTVPFWLDHPDTPEPAPPLTGRLRADLSRSSAPASPACGPRSKRRSATPVGPSSRSKPAGSPRARGGATAGSSPRRSPTGSRTERRGSPTRSWEIERQSAENFRGIATAIERYGIDADFERVPEISLARTPHQTAWFAEAAELAARFGHDVDVLDRDAAQAIVRSPVVIGGYRQNDGHALVDPARLA